MSSSEFIWIQLSSSVFKWVQANPNESKWVHVSQVPPPCSQPVLFQPALWDQPVDASDRTTSSMVVIIHMNSRDRKRFAQTFMSFKLPWTFVVNLYISKIIASDWMFECCAKGRPGMFVVQWGWDRRIPQCAFLCELRVPCPPLGLPRSPYVPRGGWRRGLLSFPKVTAGAWECVLPDANPQALLKGIFLPRFLSYHDVCRY
jgi:hypothetical protein